MCNADIGANYTACSRGSARNGRNLSNRTSVVERNDARKMASLRKGGVGQRARDPVTPQNAAISESLKAVRFQVVTACNQPAMHQPVRTCSESSL